MSKGYLYGVSRKIFFIKDPIGLLSWIERGKTRKQVFLNIGKRTTPSQIIEKIVGENERKSASDYAQVSRALQELETMGLIKCLNPNEKTGRFYSFTNKGEKLLQELTS